MSVKGRRAARYGLNAEEELKGTLMARESSLISCLKRIGILPLGSTVRVANITRAERNRYVKSDLCIHIEGDLNEIVCLSLKSVRTASFHQLDRRWLDEWKAVLNMNDDVYKVLWRSILRVAKNSRDVFIEAREQPLVKRFIEDKKRLIIEEAFRHGEKELKILAIWDRRGSHNTLHLFNMDDVIEILARQGVGFTGKGIIKIGEFVSIQRKGGNGKRYRGVYKTDPRHPGNQLQIKFDPIGFVEFTRRSNVDVRRCEIDLSGSPLSNFI